MSAARLIPESTERRLCCRILSFCDACCEVIMEITPEIVKEFLEYDPSTGIFRWIPRDRKWFCSDRAWKIWTTKYEMRQAGWLCNFKEGYKARLIGFPKSNSILAHRAAWAWMTGGWPQDQIDHIDHDPTNNRWSNLRQVNNQGNHFNRPRQKNNKSGFTGVCWHKASKKWHSRIKISGKDITLGFYDDLDEAVNARKLANKRYGFLKSHGSDLPGRQYNSDFYGGSI